MATAPTPNAHRVLQSDGKVSPGFAWLDPARTDDPREMLLAEGVSFDAHSRADQAQRITTEELAMLIGTEIPEAVPDRKAGKGGADRFAEQLAEQQGPAISQAVLAVLTTWTELGGRLEYGVAPSETSCYLMSRSEDDPRGDIWPAVVYPSGKFEVVFQHLRSRPPFDDPEVREELRLRLNKVDGVDLPASKIDLRPGFGVELLAEPAARDQLAEAFEWIYTTANQDDST
jgi:hypothetical protein